MMALSLIIFSIISEGSAGHLKSFLSPACRRKCSTQLQLTVTAVSYTERPLSGVVDSRRGRKEKGGKSS